MTLVYSADGTTFPPRGVLGGGDAKASRSAKRGTDGKLVDLPAFHEEACSAGERIEFVACGGGGYGEPTKRDARRVAASVGRGWLSSEAARESYKVALMLDADQGVWVVDYSRHRPASDSKHQKNCF